MWRFEPHARLTADEGRPYERSLHQIQSVAVRIKSNTFFPALLDCLRNRRRRVGVKAWRKFPGITRSNFQATRGESALVSVRSQCHTRFAGPIIQGGSSKCNFARHPIKSSDS